MFRTELIVHHQES